MAVVKPVPGLDVPVINSTGNMNQAWFEFFQSTTALLKSTTNTANAAAAATFVKSIDTATGDLTLGNGLARTLQALRVNLTSITASLGADVALNNGGLYFDGPSVAQGSTGTWVVFGTVTVLDPSNSGNIFNCKLWDGTTVIASSVMRPSLTTGGFPVGLSGVITSPAGNLRISCQAATFTTGLIRFNSSGNSKDSTITAVRIA